MTAVEIYKELVGDESKLPLTRRTLREGELMLHTGPSFDIRHCGLDVAVTARSPKRKGSRIIVKIPERSFVLPEGANQVIFEDRKLRWRIVHKSKLPR